ncbi:MAG: LPS export ABC transporter permease LptG [Nitrospinae bacterium CG11_big_fil_rev_8_21_14_0_20_56_8]|nr:MAG: LPS export ABC transporter permease LptG [Nitrospinae bacterium CG11_big_fil_rev_8_21_14_0_20_56_8]
MHILKRYVLMKFLSTYLVSVAGLIGIFLVVDFFENVDEFFSRDAPFGLVLEYYIYKIPSVIFYMGPQAILLAGAFTLAALARDNEIIAMRACGISITGITLPIIGSAAIISLLILGCNEYISPSANKKMNIIFYVKVRHNTAYGAMQTENIWLRSKSGSTWNIQLYDPTQTLMKGVGVFKNGEDNSVLQRIDAEEVIWQENKWEFHNGYLRTFKPEGLDTTEYFEKRFFPMPETPEDFEKVRIKPGELSLTEMYHSIHLQAAEGKDMSKEWVDLHQKISYPFVSIVLALLAVPLSLRSSRHGGVLFCLGVNLGTGFLFTFIYAMGISLGHSGVFGPLLAAWGPNILFMCLGFYLMLTLDSERWLPINL